MQYLIEPIYFNNTPVKIVYMIDDYVNVLDIDDFDNCINIFENNFQFISIQPKEIIKIFHNLKIKANSIYDLKRILTDKELKFFNFKIESNDFENKIIQLQTIFKNRYFEKPYFKIENKLNNVLAMIELNGIKTNYCKKQSGRIHTNNPNIQSYNTEKIKQILNKEFYKIDYEKQELKIILNLANETELIDIIKNNQDIFEYIRNKTTVQNTKVETYAYLYGSNRNKLIVDFFKKYKSINELRQRNIYKSLFGIELIKTDFTTFNHFIKLIASEIFEIKTILLYDYCSQNNLNIEMIRFDEWILTGSMNNQKEIEIKELLKFTKKDWVLPMTVKINKY